MAPAGSTLWVQYYKKKWNNKELMKASRTHTLCPLSINTHSTNPRTLKTDLQEFSRSILGRWQSPYSSVRSSNLGLRPGSEVSSLSWHVEAVGPIRPSLRAERRKTQLTVLQCQVSVQIAVRLARDNKGGATLTSQKQRLKSQTCLGWQSGKK